MTGARNSFKLTPIGVIRSEYSLENAPMQGFESEKTSKIIIFDKYTKALEGIKKYDYLIVLYWMHQSDRTQLWSKLKNRDIFTTRSPRRPNPIGISYVKNLKINGNTLEVKYLDVIDGTPILDIKPYYKEVDAR
ncbi:MAG: tRNA (N6-threonylcarbamoyladenosine(37)-N6)-methyltransferase TrmO [Candidatus Hydrothermarchaeales archaeon]